MLCVIWPLWLSHHPAASSPAGLAPVDTLRLTCQQATAPPEYALGHSFTTGRLQLLVTLCCDGMRGQHPDSALQCGTAVFCS